MEGSEKMATEVDKALLQENIEEYVNDDNKIVTCKWLSLSHNININAAKRALHVFVDHQRNKGGNDDINVTYFVAGLGKSKDGDLMHKCAVVPETEIDAVKRSLSTVTSCHIFSVQKAKLKDYTPLYMTDYEVVRNNLEKCNSLSSIKCPWVSLRTATPASKTSQQIAPTKPENKENSPVSRKTGSGNEPAPSVPKASGKKAEPKGSIASMFASAGKKDGGGDQSSKPARKDNTASKGKGKDMKGGMMAFFPKKEDSPQKKNDSPASDSSKKAAASTKISEDKTSLKQKHEPKRKKKQKNVDSDDEGPDKKRRRRIRTDLFDSSDEENDNASDNEEPEENVEEEEGPITVSPESEDADAVVAQSDEEMKDKGEAEKEREKPKARASSNSAGKKRKRTKKIVTKHYQDEDGFMVTKKETVWESETDDDEEEEPAVKEETTSKKTLPQASEKPADKNTSSKTQGKGKAVPKKNTSPQKNKQTSLMSFFKKK